MRNSEPNYDAVFHAVADPTRRKILRSLKEKGACSIDRGTGLCASDIEERISLSQPTISHHMAILRQAGLVEAAKFGQWMWYRRNESLLRKFAKALKKEI